VSDSTSGETVTSPTLEMERAIGALALELPAEVWEDVRDRWHAARDAMAEEIDLLRQVLVFADGAVLLANSGHKYHFVLADLYNETTPLQGVIARAGCHPRRAFLADKETP
jgi:hypothetical protein